MIYPIDIAWLWVLYLGFTTVVCCAAVRDGAGWAVFWLAVIAVLFFVLASPLARDTAAWAWDHRQQWPYWAVLYVALGVTWGVIKWQLYLGRRAREYERQEPELRDEHRRGLPANVLATNKEYSSWLKKRKDIPPSPAKHRDRIVVWMTWWFFSLLESLLSDLVVRVYEAIYDELAALLDRMSKRAFRRFEGLQ